MQNGPNWLGCSLRCESSRHGRVLSDSKWVESIVVGGSMLRIDMKGWGISTEPWLTPEGTNSNQKQVWNEWGNAILCKSQQLCSYSLKETGSSRLHGQISKSARCSFCLKNLCRPCVQRFLPVVTDPTSFPCVGVNLTDWLIIPRNWSSPGALFKHWHHICTVFFLWRQHSSKQEITHHV